MASSLLNLGPVALLMALTLANLGTNAKYLALPSLYLGQKTLYFLFNFKLVNDLAYTRHCFFIT
ncbi:hypothetical protein TEHN0098T_0435 [Tetragenococcus halophilus subsp. halophilus]|nr:hypothetical protein TEHN0098T_0435 [Tetragenococcus halophilus subsp. halophilus]GMA44482.1 hypothetical protein GCM10025853_19390 [Tetragenococcus halophilus subsp. halophilus DSM 20339]